MLLVPIEVELVARRCLQRQAESTDRPALGALSLSALVGIVEKPGRIAGVLVRIDAWNRSILPLVARGRVEPEPVLPDRTAEAAGHIPEFQQLAGCRQTGVSQRVAVIAADHPKIGRASCRERV